MHRFYVAAPLPVVGEVTFAGEAAHRIGRVLRLGPGERVGLFDGSGREVVAVLERVSARDAVARIASELPPPPDGPRLHLYPTLIRPARFEWLVEKAAELGATLVQPVLTERCQVRASEIGAAKLARWERLAIEAAEQCGRRTLPELRPPVPFTRALDGLAGIVLLPWEEARGEAVPAGEALRRAFAAHGAVRRVRGTPRPLPVAYEGETSPPAALAGECGDGGELSRGGLALAPDAVAQPDALPPVTIIIGPEGGLTAGEVDAARTHRALVASLGPLVLRAETAAVAAMALAVDAWAAAMRTV